MTSILLVLPVPIRNIGGELWFESQAANGLDRWAENFASVVVAAPTIPEHVLAERSSWQWVPCSQLMHAKRITLLELPWAYSPRNFFAHRGQVRQLLRRQIAQCQYLQFAVGGLFGDWASTAALEAHGMGRPFAVWTDRVESEVVRITASEKSGARKHLTLLYAELMRRYERYVIRRAHLGLFHGAETFQAYSHLAKFPFLTHDIHTKSTDLISEPDLVQKQRNASDPKRPIRIGYAGRATPMKAPLDWLGVLAGLSGMDVIYEAAWAGDGELLEHMHTFINEHSLENQVTLKGFVSDRAEVLAFLRSCDVLLFTHITPESPRIILEAMISGTPVVGYTSGYVEEIIPPSDQDLLCKIGDVERLAETVASLASDRTKLVAAMRRAREVGMSFNDDAVFKHRSDLIKQYLA
ncbi:MAG: hypothetical protein B7Y41_14220 [Hydrogenophilales bacterium 28-61-23]|nr:MAG: hypothetical protein B7Y41_14220 [Hydrogenophilales bacterium 28-61-23]